MASCSEWLEFRREKVVESEGDQIGECADGEEDGIAGGDVAERVIAVENASAEPGEENAADRSGHATEADDRADIFLREHIGDGGVEIRRPCLVRGRHEAND